MGQTSSIARCVVTVDNCWWSDNVNGVWVRLPNPVSRRRPFLVGQKQAERRGEREGGERKRERRERECVCVCGFCGCVSPHPLAVFLWPLSGFFPWLTEKEEVRKREGEKPKICSPNELAFNSLAIWVEQKKLWKHLSLRVSNKCTNWLSPVLPPSTQKVWQLQCQLCFSSFGFSS